MTTSPEDNLLLIKKVVGNLYCEVKIKSIVVSEDIELENCSIILSLQHGPVIKANGVGMVDAIFLGLKEYYSNKFSSLSGLELYKFFVKTKSHNTKSEVGVDLEIRNSYGNRFMFSDISKSLIASSAKVSAAAIEYFSNSEMAFLSLLKAFKDAKLRGREDLITRYTSELSILADNTSYSATIDKERSEYLNEIGGSKK